MFECLSVYIRGESGWDASDRVTFRNTNHSNTMFSQRDPSWRSVVPGRENDETGRTADDEPDEVTRALARQGLGTLEGGSSDEDDDAYVTDVEEDDDVDEDDGVRRAGDASESDGNDTDEFEDAEEVLAGQKERAASGEAAITTSLLSHNAGKRANAAASSRSRGTVTTSSRRSRRHGGSVNKAKSSKEALRRKAERRAYKPVTFNLLMRLFGLYVSFMAMVFLFVILTSVGAYINPVEELLELNALENLVWFVISVASFVAIPSCVAHVTGYLTWPPVWMEQFPDRGKILEELGGKVYFRFHVTRDAKPLAVKRAVDVAVEILQRAIPSTLWEIEVVTMKELGISTPSVSELVVPIEMNYQVSGSAGLLNFATQASTATWGDWVVHMGPDALLNVRAVDAVLAHCARETRLAALSGRGETHVRRLAQGAVLPGITRTSNSFIDGVESVFQWIPAMAECIRAGESYGALRMMYAKHSRVVAPIPNTFLVVPNELELAVGFKGMEVHDGFELTSFALRCSNNGVKFAWLDAGVHVPIVSNIWKLFKVRARDHHSALVLMRDDSALDPTHRASLTLACVSTGFSTIAPVVSAFAPWCIRRSGVDMFAISCIVGFITACVTFKYAVGYYKSASVADLSNGAVSGTVYYNILFLLTIVLTPVFCVFEFIALCTSIFYDPAYFGGETEKSRGPIVKILEDDDDDFDWLERGQARDIEREVLLPAKEGQETVVQSRGDPGKASPRVWRRGGRQ